VNGERDGDRAARIGRGPAEVARIAERPTARQNDASTLGRVDADPERALAAWAELEAIAPGSLYQTRRWPLPWIAAAGRTAGLESMLVVGYRNNLPVVFFPLDVARHGSLWVAGFLTPSDKIAWVVYSKRPFGGPKAALASCEAR
jgi:CelD/BcsL family acetyltransferase involved in cellulose biosynthesis